MITRINNIQPTITFRREQRQPNSVTNCEACTVSKPFSRKEPEALTFGDVIQRHLARIREINRQNEEEKEKSLQRIGNVVYLI